MTRDDPVSLRVHHVGAVVADLAKAVAAYRELGFATEGPVVHDPAQEVRIQFLIDPAGAARVELLEPVGDASPVREALASGGGLNHLCFMVEDLDQASETLRVRGVVRISRPVPAPAISGSRIAFFFDRVRGVFELVEAPGRITSEVEPTH